MVMYLIYGYKYCFVTADSYTSLIEEIAKELLKAIIDK